MKLKDKICEMEFTWLPLVLFWGFIVLGIVGAVAFIYAAIHLMFGYVIFLGTIDNGIKVERNNNFCEIEHPEIEPVQEPVTPVIETEPYKVGCEYWNGYIDTMEANEVEKAWLKRMVFCESTCNPYAVSYMSAEGILQFTVPTWFDFGGDRDIKNPYHQLEVGLEMYGRGLQSRWCCNDLI